MSNDDTELRALHREMLDTWNRRDAKAFAACFTEHGSVVGFDGSAANGRAEIESHLAPIFVQHQTPVFIEKVREVRPLGTGVALLRAVVGMVPAGGNDINPALNAVQSIVASNREGRWRIDLLQNTPAAYHGRQDVAAKLTAELREVWRSRSGLRM
jgi:uncharacterized protein (TIGR02246 family)